MNIERTCSNCIYRKEFELLLFCNHKDSIFNDGQYIKIFYEAYNIALSCKYFKPDYSKHYAISEIYEEDK